MAWNEPGGSGGKDPWGRNNEQGPPDLDEVVRKLRRRFGGVFGGGQGPSSGLSGSSVLGILVLAVVIWALSGIYIVDEGKRGVVLQFGEYKETTLPGPHWHPRFIQTVEKVDVGSIRAVELGYRPDESLMLTQDENIIDIKFAAQYRIKDPQKYLFNVRDPETTLRYATESAVREIVGKNKMDFVITGGRSEVAARAQILSQEILDRYETGIVITTLNMQDAQAPEQVQDAFADAVKAREDEQRLINEAEAYANDILPKARGRAARVVEEANAYKARVIAEAEGETARFASVLSEYQKAPEVMRKRLYIDAMESVLGKSSKVILDAQSGTNLLYLPLDRIAGGGVRVTGSEVDAQPAAEPKHGEDNRTIPSRLRDTIRQREVR